MHSFSRRRPVHVSWFAEFLQLSFVLVVFSYFLLPSDVLVLMKWNYLGGGPEFEKIHLATYLLLVVVGLMLVVDARFRNTVIEIYFTDLTLTTFVVAVAATAAYAIAAKHVSIAPFVDTFVAAIIATIGCICLSERYSRLLKKMLDAYFIASIAIVFIESYSKSSVLFSSNNGYYESYFRARALFEGPLSAATLLGLYSLVNLVSTRITLSLACATRLLLSFASFSAIFTTGGRTSLVAVIFIVAGLFGVVALKQMARGYINKAGLIYSVAAIPVLTICLLLFLWLGLFDTIVERFRNDIGSAFTRQLALDLLFNMSATQLWFGLSASDVLNLVSVQTEFRLIAIEISWVNFILVCGLLFTVPLFTTYVIFIFRFLSKYCGLIICIPSLFLLINTSASNGIWAKTTILTTSLVLMVTFLRKPSANARGK